MIREHLSGKTLSRESLAKYENDDQPTPYLIAEAAEKAYQLQPGKLTSVYYMDDLKSSSDLMDSGSSVVPKVAQEAAKRAYVSVVVKRPKGAAQWSAKGVDRVTKYVQSLFGGAWGYVSLDRAMGEVRAGAVLVMLPDDYEGEGVFRVFVSREDADQEVLGWIDPDAPLTIATEYGDRLSLAQYRPVAFAFAVCWGAGDVLSEVRISGTGIGPNTRI